jgi:hypothetical protein
VFLLLHQCEQASLVSRILKSRLEIVVKIVVLSTFSGKVGLSSLSEAGVSKGGTVDVAVGGAMFKPKMLLFADDVEDAERNVSFFYI